MCVNQSITVFPGATAGIKQRLEERGNRDTVKGVKPAVS